MSKPDNSRRNLIENDKLEMLLRGEATEEEKRALLALLEDRDFAYRNAPELSLALAQWPRQKMSRRLHEKLQRIPQDNPRSSRVIVLKIRKISAYVLATASIAAAALFSLYFPFESRHSRVAGIDRAQRDIEVAFQYLEKVNHKALEEVHGRLGKISTETIHTGMFYPLMHEQDSI